MNKQLLTNALSSSIQFILVGASVFFLYRFLLTEIGPERLGLWSLAIALMTTSNVIGLGLRVAVVKYVAKYLVYDDQKKVALLIETALLTVAVIFGVVLVPLYYLFEFLFSKIVEGDLFLESIAIMPFILFAFWISSLNQIFWAAVDGYQRIDIRNIAFTLANGLYVFLAVWLTPRFGLMGLAYAHLSRSTTFLIFGVVVIKMLSSEVKVLSFRWDRSLFKEMFSYGKNFQIISISQIVMDPVTKYYLAQFGSLEMVGYFEMAFQMVRQIGGIILSANSAIVPVIAELQENARERLKKIYENIYLVLFFINLPFYAILITLVPIISKIWIGFVENDFVFFAIVLSLAYFVDSLVGPAYFINMGTGNLKHNVLSHLIIASISAGFGYLLGKEFGGRGVVVSLSIAISVGSLYLMAMYSKEEDVSLRFMFSVENRNLIFSVGLFVLGVRIIFDMPILRNMNVMIQISIIFIMFALLNFLPIWNHSKRKEIQGWVLGLLPKRGPLFPKSNKFS